MGISDIQIPYDYCEEEYDPHDYGKATEEEKEAFMLGLNNF